MHKGRLEAFTDAVIAIALTIMVLDLKPPKEITWQNLCREDGHTFLVYVLSFVFLGIYWNNHHHLVQAAKHVNGAVLWANLHLLFWLSLVPFCTQAMGDHLTPVTAALYGIVLLLSGIAYSIFARLLVRANREDRSFGEALGGDRKGWISIGLYTLGIIVASWAPFVSAGLYVAVALMWIVPDPRFERKVVE